MDDFTKLVQLILSAVLGGLISHLLTHTRERKRRELEKYDRLMLTINQAEAQAHDYIYSAFDRVLKDELVRKSEYLQGQIEQLEVIVAMPSVQSNEHSSSALNQLLASSKLALQRMPTQPSHVDVRSMVAPIRSYLAELDVLALSLPHLRHQTTEFTEALRRLMLAVNDIQAKIEIGSFTDYQREKWSAELASSLEEVSSASSKVREHVRTRVAKLSDWRS